MKRALLSGLSMLALISSASAADLPRQNAPYRAPAMMSGYNWTGFYLGLVGGGAWGRSNWDGFGVSNSPTGGMFGATAGYNWQGASPWVFGLEGDIAWAGTRASVTCAGATCETRNDWLGTVRGRVGYSWDRIMPYVTGGVGFGNIKANRTGFTGASDSRAGWALGAGVEAAIAGRWTGKLEYVYTDLGSIGCSAAACGVATNVGLDLHMLRAGANYRF